MTIDESGNIVSANSFLQDVFGRAPCPSFSLQTPGNFVCNSLFSPLSVPSTVNVVTRLCFAALTICQVLSKGSDANERRFVDAEARV